MVRFFKSHGWTVIELNRSGRILSGGDDARVFNLGDDLPHDLNHIHALIHAAYDLNAVTWTDIENTNVHGTRRLIRSAKRANVHRIIYISSMSAFKGCKSLYGKAKLLSEKIVDECDGISFRPGLIYDSVNPGGMLGKLLRIIRIFPVIPIPASKNNFLYLTHQEDLCVMIHRYCSEKIPAINEAIIAANPSPLNLASILKRFAAKKDKKLLLIPLDWRLFFLFLRSLEILKIKPIFRSDSLVSLMNQNPAPLFLGDSAFQFRDLS